jgi:Flp pilus assembly protein TadB
MALPVREVDRFARAARRLSDRSGAPLSDMLDRLEAHQRALSRLDNLAHAQAAGARLTALILLAMPPLALALGHSIGADALGVLFQTSAGLACTTVAVVLQLAGLAWTDRLSRSRHEPLHTEMAVASDLAAAALRAGLPVPSAILHVGEVLDGPLSMSLTQIGRELSAGVSPKQAWQRLGRFEAARRLVNAALRTSESGAAMSGALTRCADDLRADAEHERQARVQRASVLLMLPLGLCFLPAFLLAGLVPVVLAVVSEVL